MSRGRRSRAALAQRLRRGGAVMIALCAVGAQLPAVVGGQSLAEVARAEAERRKAIPRPARLYTNKDLVPVAPPPAPAAQDDEDAQADRGDEDSHVTGELPENPPHGRRRDEADSDEQQWRRRVAEARQALERGQTIADALQSRLNALVTDFAARDDPAQRGVIAADVQKARAELERVRAEVEARQAAIAAIEEDARRAGVPPGWLR